MMSEQVDILFIKSIFEISRNDWQALIATDYPFIQYDFLAGLESSGVTCFDTGWQPHHLVVKNSNGILLLIPFYLKTHSYGEYVFDFQWADAFQRAGGAYYPKLLSAIPYTPASSKRIYCCLDPQQTERLLTLAVEYIKQWCQQNAVSSWHLLFPTESESNQLTQLQIMQRTGIQYHWFNKNYQSFDDFLLTCKMKSRKNIKNERRKVLEQGIRIERLSGKLVTEALWKQFYSFYQLTYLKRSGHGGYLNQPFFSQLGTDMADSIMMTVAYLGEEVIATSLFFLDKQNLYGRYWGCKQEFDFLHFELCYYQGIEFCIEQQLVKFDAGAQGEHKIQRGFEPVKTFSNHWIKHPQFSQLIQQFLNQETIQVESGITALASKLPFKL